MNCKKIAKYRWNLINTNTVKAKYRTNLKSPGIITLIQLSLSAVFKSTNKTSPNQTPPRPYSPAILAQIPVKQLLLYAGQNHAHYSALYPSLLRLTATHLPQLCLVEDWLKGEEHSDRGEPAYTSCNIYTLEGHIFCRPIKCFMNALCALWFVI